MFASVSAARLLIPLIAPVVPEIPDNPELESFPGKVAFAIDETSDDGVDSVQKVFEANADGSEPKLIGVGDRDSYPTISPSGSKLAYQAYKPRGERQSEDRHESRLGIYDFSTGNTIYHENAFSDPNGYSFLRWSADESAILYTYYSSVNSNRYLGAFHLASQKSNSIVSLGDRAIPKGSPALSPDNSKLALCEYTWGNLNTIMVVDLDEQWEITRYNDRYAKHWESDGRSATNSHDPTLFFQWFPDGSSFTFFITCESARDTGTYFCNPDTNEFEKISDLNLNLSPDGNYLISNMKTNDDLLIEYDVLDWNSQQWNSVVIPETNAGNFLTSTPTYLGGADRLGWISNLQDPDTFLPIGRRFSSFNIDGSELVQIEWPFPERATSLSFSGTTYQPR